MKGYFNRSGYRVFSGLFFPVLELKNTEKYGREKTPITVNFSSSFSQLDTTVVNKGDFKHFTQN